MYLLSAACGTYCIILQMVIIFILRLFNQLWCVIVKEKKNILLPIFNSDDVVMPRGNRKKIHLRFL